MVTLLPSALWSVQDCGVTSFNCLWNSFPKSRVTLTRFGITAIYSYVCSAGII